MSENHTTTDMASAAIAPKITMRKDEQMMLVKANMERLAGQLNWLMSRSIQQEFQLETVHGMLNHIAANNQSFQIDAETRITIEDKVVEMMKTKYPELQLEAHRTSDKKDELEVILD